MSQNRVLVSYGEGRRLKERRPDVKGKWRWKNSGGARGNFRPRLFARTDQVALGVTSRYAAAKIRIYPRWSVPRLDNISCASSWDWLNCNIYANALVTTIGICRLLAVP
jgi:hypothetical protein